MARSKISILKERLRRYSTAIALILSRRSKHPETSAAWAKEKRVAVNEQFNNIKRAWTSYVMAEMPKTYGKKASALRKLFSTFSARPATYQKRTVRALEDQMLLDMFTAVEGGKRQVGRFLRMTQQQAIKDRKVSQAVADGLIEGTPKSVKNELLTALQKKIGNDQFIEVNGKQWNAEAYAEMVARTRLREAQSTATINQAQEMGIDLIRVSDHGDTDPSCDLYAGRVFSISGTSKEYPPLTEFPPFHPNCIHTINPFIPAKPGTKRADIQEKQLAAADARAEKTAVEIKEKGFNAVARERRTEHEKRKEAAREQNRLARNAQARRRRANRQS